MYRVCCDLEYCQIEAPVLNTAHGQIWPPADVLVFQWQHMHHVDQHGHRQRERGCFWQAIVNGPPTGNQSTPWPDDPRGIEDTMAGIR